MNNEWISVSERLPDKDGRYLVSKSIFNDTTEVISNFNSAENNFYTVYTGYYDIITDDVIAWMPLPAPYINPIKEVKIIFEVPKWTTENNLINFIKDKINIDDTYITNIKLEEDDECSDS